MATAAAPAMAKRKREQTRHPELSFRKMRRVEAQDARVISAQTSGKAFGDGQVDVDAFVRARRYEISALEDALRRSKKALSLRAFQSLPRHLRRRAASHKPAKVPKRLRSRAVQQMIQDNTPINKPRPLDKRKRLRLQNPNSTSKKGKVTENPNAEKIAPNSAVKSNSKSSSKLRKNRLLEPPLPGSKFRKRQVNKTWLPTHLFHAKRAHMSPPNAPLWRMAIPLSPTAKAYRSTHRATTCRGAVAWDTSYMSTISLEGTESNILEVLKALGVGYEKRFNYQDRESVRWIAGSRFWQGWLYKPLSNQAASIAPAEIAWISRISSTSAAAKKPLRKAFVRIHPSAFLELWEIVLPLCKSQKPPVKVSDLRFEIGSIDLVGPSSTEALVGVLHPTPEREATAKDHFDIERLWSMFALVNGAGSLPSNAVICMDVTDPRLQAQSRYNERYQTGDPEGLLETLADWPLDKNPCVSNLFDTAARRRACRQVPSQKAVNRRKSVVIPGVDPEPLATDPQIPVVMLTARNGSPQRSGWTLLLPWKCLRIFWYCIIYQQLPSGNTTGFGGLNEQRQIMFEAQMPWFPADYPGTKAGLAWEEQERIKRKQEWGKRPKGRRVEWESLDLGLGRKGEVGEGWACDWNALLRIDELTDREELPELRLERIPFQDALSTLQGRKKGDIKVKEKGIVEVKVEMLSRGVPHDCARIYRLPREDEGSRAKWLSLRTSNRCSTDSNKRWAKARKETGDQVRQQQLAASLLATQDKDELQQGCHPPVPGEKDLIGFITTGSFNPSDGKGLGIGSILLSKVLPRKEVESASENSAASLGSEDFVCIVRDAGQSIGRLARWQLAR